METIYYLEAFRKTQGEFKTNGVFWDDRIFLERALNRTKEAGLVTICYFRIKLKPQA